MEMLTDLTIAVLNGPTKTKRVSEVCKALLLTMMQRKNFSFTAQGNSLSIGRMKITQFFVCLEAKFVFVMEMQIECVLPTNNISKAEVDVQTYFLVARIPLAVCLFALYVMKGLYLHVLWCLQDIMFIEDCNVSKQDRVLPDQGAQIAHVRVTAWPQSSLTFPGQLLIKFRILILTEDFPLMSEI